MVPPWYFGSRSISACGLTLIADVMFLDGVALCGGIAAVALRAPLGGDGGAGAPAPAPLRL